MAKDSDLHSNDKSKAGERPPRRDVIPFDSLRRGRKDFRPIDSDKGQPEGSWPGFWPWSLPGAGPIFMLGIAILCGLYTGITYKKQTAANLKPQEQLRLGPTSHSSSKPSPNPSAVTAHAAGSLMSEKASVAVSNSTGVPALHDHPLRYEATHKKVFGGCTGQLELTSARLHFRCPNEADLDIPVGSIAKAHKDGVVLASGEKYHFLIANHTKSQVEAIFTLWLNRVQHFQQLSRKSSF